MENLVRESGIQAIGSIPWSTHFCLFYRTKQDLADMLVSYFKAGLKNNEFCMCVTSDPLDETGMKELMREAVPGFDEYLEKGQFEITTDDKWYVTDDLFDYRRVLDGWLEKLNQALDRGYDGIRVTGNVSWLEKPVWDDFLAYERKVNNEIGRQNIIALCTYPLDKCSAEKIMDIVSAHQFALTKSNGIWKLIENLDALETRKALYESEEKYRVVAENTYDWEFWLDPEGRVIYTSPSCKRITGYTARELTENSSLLFEITHPEDRPAFRAHCHSEQPDSHSDLEFRIRSKDGEIRWIHHVCQPIFDNNGRYIGTRGSNRDITERKLAEDALRDSERKFRAIFDQTFQLTGLMTPDGMLIEVNRTALMFIGAEEQEVIGKLFWETPWWTHSKKLQEKLRRAVKKAAGGEFVRFEASHPAADGSRRYIDTSIKPVKDGSGRVILLIPEGRDITERRRMEEALEFERSQLLNIFDSIDEAIYIADTETYKILYANKAMQGKFGKNFVGGTCYVELQGRDAPCEFCTNSIILKNKGEPYRWEYHNPTVNRDFLIVDRIIKWPDGRDVRFELAVDITERKRIEKDLNDAKARAELYLDLMGHDINNMHQIALGYLELAREMYPDTSQQDLLDKPIEVLQRSARLIQNVRKLQKLHDGEFNTVQVDTCQMLADVRREYGAMPGKAISLDLNGYEHCYVRANELLHDVFANMVSNAIKHTRGQANIGINLEVAGEKGDQHCLLTVEDNGPGIPDDFKARIFNRMLKGTVKEKGMGLGLYLVKSLVESYGGHVWVEDRVPGDHTKGAKFVVRLPVTGTCRASGH